MEEKEKKKGIVQEWFQSFIENLKKLAEHMKTDGAESSNETYTSIGTTPESKKLIAELICELDEEYTIRRELDKVIDLDAWFKKKVDETMDDLAKDGIIDTPTSEDYDQTFQTIQEALFEKLADDAEQTSRELNCETDELTNCDEEFLTKERV